MNCRMNDIVVFGRANGEQTIGKVVKINAKSVKVMTLEARGYREKVGLIWRVHPSLIRAATAAELATVGTSASTPKRSERDMMKDIAAVYSQLSPENLTADGERSPSAVKERRTTLNKIMLSLQNEIGRFVSETEAYSASR